MQIPWTGAIGHIVHRRRSSELSLLERLDQRARGANDRDSARVGRGGPAGDPELGRTFLRAGGKPTVRR